MALSRHERVRRKADLNPLEMAFSKLKALIRKAAARTYEQLWQAVGHVCGLFKDEECYNFFKAAGKAYPLCSGSPTSCAVKACGRAAFALCSPHAVPLENGPSDVAPGLRGALP